MTEKREESVFEVNDVILCVVNVMTAIRLATEEGILAEI